MALVLSAVVCFASGFLLVCLGWLGRGARLPYLLLRGSLAVGYGLGLFSVTFFLARVCNVTHLMGVDLCVLASLIAVFVLVARSSRTAPGLTRSETRSHTHRLRRVLAPAFVIALGSALYSALLRLRAYPHGDGWDAFAIWNLHARFLFRGGPHWRDGFTSLIPGSHPDYPLLLPSAIAHFWGYLGREERHVPGVIALLFTIATIAALYAALSILRGRVQAMLGTTVLVATPFFVEQGAAQYADVPLGFFFLATVVLLCLHDGEPGEGAPLRGPGFLAQAGIAAGFAAWTKNEGLLFLGAIVVARLLILIRSWGNVSTTSGHAGLGEIRTAAAPLIGGMVPLLLIIAYFKHSIAPPSELFADPKATLGRVLDLARYWAIVKWYLKDFFRFGHWLLVPGSLLLVGLYFVAGKEDGPAELPGFRTSVLALALTLAGYFAVYLITPYDIYWHLRFSLSRLFLQVWPAVVFLFFSGVQGLPAISRREPLEPD